MLCHFFLFFKLCSWCLQQPQARNQLGTPGGAQIFLTMSNSFEPCPTHFSRGDEKFSRGLRPPWLWAWTAQWRRRHTGS